MTDEPTGSELEAHARTLYEREDYPGSIEEHQRAFGAYQDERDARGASRVARLLSWLHINVYSEFAVAGGWLARAQEVLAASGGAEENGWIDLALAVREPHDADREQRLRTLVDGARRTEDADLRVAALAALGETVAMTGRVDEGMVLFDTSLAAVCAGEVEDLYVVESVFCAMFLTCERVHDVPRAEQWLRAAGEFVRRRNVVAVGPLCRAHYGGLLTAAGRWDEAEAELEEAARVFAAGYPAARAIVFVRLGDLRVRQGRLEEAGELLAGLDPLPDAARPLAALHLARGDTVLARDVLERRLGMPAIPAPWPIGTTQPLPASVAGPLLALLIDVYLAEGAGGPASEAAERLTRLADEHGGDHLRGCAALATGRLGVASGAQDATARLRHAVEAFAAARMPVELARARVELARAVGPDQPEVAIAEARAALEAFEHCRATRDADATAALLRSLGGSGRSAPKGRSPLTRREEEVLDLLGHGLTNPEIASRLFISRKTAEHHVGHILFKLDLRNRSEAAAYAARANLGSPRTE